MGGDPFAQASPGQSDLGSRAREVAAARCGSRVAAQASARARRRTAPPARGGRSVDGDVDRADAEFERRQRSVRRVTRGSGDGRPTIGAAGRARGSSRSSVVRCFGPPRGDVHLSGPRRRLLHQQVPLRSDCTGSDREPAMVGRRHRGRGVTRGRPAPGRRPWMGASSSPRAGPSAAPPRRADGPGRRRRPQ